MKDLLTVKKLRVTVADQELLADLSFKLAAGEIAALMGANGAGKSTLGRALMGDPDYMVEAEELSLNGKNLLDLEIEARAQAGMAYIWQQAPEIKGVELFSLLNLIQQLHDGDYDYQLADPLLFRETNVGFSGGEKKIAELVQVLNQKPKLIIIDELDSGLDIENLDKVLSALKKEVQQQKIAILLITHSGAVLEELKPDRIMIMRQGKIICQSQKIEQVLNTIKEYGYQKCEQCQNCL